MSYREEFASSDLDEQAVKEELQAFRSGLEGYAFGILRGLRLSESENSSHSQDLLDSEDGDEILELVKNKMVLYMDSMAS